MNIVRLKLQHCFYEKYDLLFIGLKDYDLYDQKIRLILQSQNIEYMILYEDYEKLKRLAPMPSKIYYSSNIDLDKLEQSVIAYRDKICIVPWEEIYEESFSEENEPIAIISEDELPVYSYSGTGVLNKIPEKIPEKILQKYNLPSKTSIVAEKKAGGYAIHIESNLAFRLLVVFKKDDEILYETEISERLPSSKELIPNEIIKNFKTIELKKFF